MIPTSAENVGVQIPQLTDQYPSQYVFLHEIPCSAHIDLPIHLSTYLTY